MTAELKTMGTEGNGQQQLLIIKIIADFFSLWHCVKTELNAPVGDFQTSKLPKQIMS